MEGLLRHTKDAGYDARATTTAQSLASPRSPNTLVGHTYTCTTNEPQTMLELLLEIALEERELADGINAKLVRMAEINRVTRAKKYLKALHEFDSVIQQTLLHEDNLVAKLKVPRPSQYLGLSEDSHRYDPG